MGWRDKPIGSWSYEDHIEHLDDLTRIARGIHEAKVGEDRARLVSAAWYLIEEVSRQVHKIDDPVEMDDLRHLLLAFGSLLADERWAAPLIYKLNHYNRGWGEYKKEGR